MFAHRTVGDPPLKPLARPADGKKVEANVSVSNPAAGWYPDPQHPGAQRYWDGQTWTERLSVPPPVAQAIPMQGAQGTHPRARVEPRKGPQRAAIVVPVSRTYWAALIAAGAAVIGSMSPWASAVIVTANGTSGDGRYTLIAGLVAAGVLLLSEGPGREPTYGAATWSAVLGAIVGLIGIYDFIHISTTTSSIFGEDVQIVQPEWGLVLTIAAGIGLAVSAWLLRIRQSLP